MAEAFSSGFNGEVFPLSDKEKQLFSQADLVKVERKKRPLDFLVVFYSLKIAQLLFPDNFIAVHYASRYGEPPLLYQHKLYSVQAEVHPNHAIFSSHMDVVATKNGTEKASTCDCYQCITHRNFHRDNEIPLKALDLEEQVNKYGITIPVSDESDCCLDREGHIVFFELEDLNMFDLNWGLNQKTVLSEEEKRALKLSRRLDVVRCLNKAR